MEPDILQHRLTEWEYIKMSKSLYLECGSGISGDMTVAALLDLGADQEVLEKALESLQLPGYKTAVTRVKKSGLDACDFNVILDAEHENHDHDMAYLHGDMAKAHGHGEEHPAHEQEHTHDHDHNQEHPHDHNHTHTHDHAYSHDHAHAGEHHHHHEHRGLPEILTIIRRGDLTPGARALAERIFQILAEAEAKAHGVPLDQVHFHEVGAVDSIVDIVAAAVCLDNLAPDEVIVTGLCEGSGFIRCQHGLIPVPVPAVLNIVQTHGLTLIPTGIKGELVTPTGAAIVAAIRTKEKLPSSFKCTKTGLGAGKRTYERPSLLRAMMLETEENDEKDTIWKLECNIDDCTGETLGYCMGKLLQAGARDVHYIPVYMKKNRPAYQLDVICEEEKRETLENIIFTETTTIGIRRCQMERTVMKREFATITTEYGDAAVKICRHGEIEKVYPEYESAALIAEKSGMPVGEAGAWIVQKYKEGK